MNKENVENINKIQEYIDKITKSHAKNHVHQKEYCEELLLHAKKNDSPYGIAFALTYLGDYYVAKGDFYKSLTITEKAISYNQKEHYYQLLMKSYHIRAIILNANREHYLGLDDFLNALKIAEELNDREFMWTSNNNIGCIFYNLKNYKKAEYYFIRAIELSESLPNLKNNIRFYTFPRMNLADCHCKLKNYDKTSSIILEMEEVFRNSDYLPGKLALLCTKIDVFFHTDERQKALDLFDQFLIEIENNDDEISMLTVKIEELANLAIQIHDEVRSKKCIHIVEKIVSNVKNVLIESQLIALNIAFNTAFGYDNQEQYHLYYLNKCEQEADAAKFRNASLMRMIEEEDTIRENATKNEVNEILAALSKIDELTQLPNRRSMNERLESYFLTAKKEQKKLCLMIADLDYFKQYNDLFGHLAGDELLKNVSLSLQRQAKKDFYPTRYGGDEFVILGYNKTMNEITQYIQNVTNDIFSLNMEYEVNQRLVQLNLSFGVFNGIPSESELDCNHLIGYADVDLYDKKKLKKAKDNAGN